MGQEGGELFTCTTVLLRPDSVRLLSAELKMQELWPRKAAQPQEAVRLCLYFSVFALEVRRVRGSFLCFYKLLNHLLFNVQRWRSRQGENTSDGVIRLCRALTVLSLVPMHRGPIVWEAFSCLQSDPGQNEKKDVLEKKEENEGQHSWKQPVVSPHKSPPQSGSQSDDESERECGPLEKDYSAAYRSFTVHGLRNDANHRIPSSQQETIKAQGHLSEVRRLLPCTQQFAADSDPVHLTSLNDADVPPRGLLRTIRMIVFEGSSLTALFKLKRDLSFLTVILSARDISSQSRGITPPLLPWVLQAGIWAEQLDRVEGVVQSELNMRNLTIVVCWPSVTRRSSERLPVHVQWACQPVTQQCGGGSQIWHGDASKGEHILSSSYVSAGSHLSYPGTPASLEATYSSRHPSSGPHAHRAALRLDSPSNTRKHWPGSSSRSCRALHVAGRHIGANPKCILSHSK
ncbi:unnamed protein product [Pleuronectes platessa]|uniref:Uncharacterized protein n=1 Tax=Pleuronectes platessa TaxID=8262 RepID=A0A9N7V6A2_PLEPL|nr:unnamed protein product [Pleuronectes platessa]